MAPFFNTAIQIYYADDFQYLVDDLQHGIFPTLADDLNEPINSICLTKNRVDNSVQGQMLNLVISSDKTEREGFDVPAQEDELNHIPITKFETSDRMSEQSLNLYLFNEKTEPASNNLQAKSDDMAGSSYMRNLDIDGYSDEQQTLWNDSVNMIPLDTNDMASFGSQLLNMDIENGKEESVVANFQNHDNNNILVPVFMDQDEILRHRKELKRQRNREAAKRFRKKSIELSNSMKNEILQLQKENKLKEVKLKELKNEIKNKNDCLKKFENENKILQLENVKLKISLSNSNFV